MTDVISGHKCGHFLIRGEDKTTLSIKSIIFPCKSTNKKMTGAANFALVNELSIKVYLVLSNTYQY